MTRQEFLESLDEVVDLAPGTLKGDEQLANVEGWDSVSLLGFIALMHGRFGIRITGHQIIECKTVNDLIALAGDEVAAA